MFCSEQTSQELRFDSTRVQYRYICLVYECYHDSYPTTNQRDKMKGRLYFASDKLAVHVQMSDYLGMDAFKDADGSVTVDDCIKFFPNRFELTLADVPADRVLEIERRVKQQDVWPLPTQELAGAHAAPDRRLDGWHRRQNGDTARPD